MALYIIIGHDVPDSLELRKQFRSAHLERLTVLDELRRLIIAGPTPIAHGEPEMSGSVLVVDFDSDEAVQAWASEEPYLLNGVYSHVDIKPFIQVFPKSAS